MQLLGTGPRDECRLPDSWGWQIQADVPIAKKCLLHCKQSA